MFKDILYNMLQILDLKLLKSKDVLHLLHIQMC